MKQFSVGYHRALKKIIDVPGWTSNHFVCHMTGFLTYNHYVNYIIFRSIKGLFEKPCSFIKKCRYFLIDHSIILKEANIIFKNVYNVNISILDNDLQAILSRVYFVFCNERSSMNEQFY